MKLDLTERYGAAVITEHFEICNGRRTAEFFNMLLDQACRAYAQGEDPELESFEVDVPAGITADRWRGCLEELFTLGRKHRQKWIN